jgi:hypothetical protein
VYLIVLDSPPNSAELNNCLFLCVRILDSNALQLQWFHELRDDIQEILTEFKEWYPFGNWHFQDCAMKPQFLGLRKNHNLFPAGNNIVNEIIYSIKLPFVCDIYCGLECKSVFLSSKDPQSTIIFTYHCLVCRSNPIIDQNPVCSCWWNSFVSLKNVSPFCLPHWVSIDAIWWHWISISMSIAVSISIHSNSSPHCPFSLSFPRFHPILCHLSCSSFLQTFSCLKSSDLISVFPLRIRHYQWQFRIDISIPIMSVKTSNPWHFLRIQIPFIFHSYSIHFHVSTSSSRVLLRFDSA